MVRTIAIAAGITVTFATLLGLATAVLANDPNVIKLPLRKKPCTWIEDMTVVPSGGQYHDRDDGSKWNCYDGRFTCVSHCPRDPRDKRR
jgi:hypothetical protein